MLESLRYDAETGAVALSVSFASFADGEAFKQSLQGLGAQVVEGGSRQEGSRVFSELTVRRGS
jgi:type II secretory pathway component PulL